ncbi:MAG: MATE family efflux transporter [Butyrivibrio sp.]|nr:MATE family efflux transporter [Butyrivibrio sp.]MBR1642911.1 MATE family efflux transporter [Butyrivibrio sp.]
MPEKQKELFESDNLWKSILSMVIPALLAILVMLLYNMADMVFVGQTGETAQVAAVSIVGPVFNLIMAVAMLLSAGGTVLISKDLGAKNEEHARQISAVCMWGAIFLGILSTMIIVGFGKPLLEFLGTTPDTYSYARTYMIILALGAPFLLISNMLGQLLRAEGAVKDGLIGNLAGTAVNTILDPIFILVLGMGVGGAAIATVMGNIVATTFYLRYMKKKAVVLNMRLSNAKKKPLLIFTVMALGLPNAVSTVLSGFANSFANRLLSGYGSDSIAANAAAGRVNQIIVMVLMGICMGVQPLISYNYGAGNLSKLSGIMKRILILCTVGGAMTTALVISFRTATISLFLKDASVAAVAESIITLLMLSSPFLGLFYLATNFLQATGKAASATVISSLQKGALLIPLLFILETIFGFYGVIYAYVVADFSAVVIASIALIINWLKVKKELQPVLHQNLKLHTKGDYGNECYN